MSMWQWVVARAQHLQRLQEVRLYSSRSGAGGKNKNTTTNNNNNQNSIKGTRQRLAKLDSKNNDRLESAAQRLLAGSGDREALKRVQAEEQLRQQESTRSIRPEPQMTPREQETQKQALRIMRDARQPTVRTMAEAMAEGEEKFPVQMRFEEMFASRGPASQHFMVGNDPEAIDRLGERLRSRGVQSAETRHVFERIQHHGDDHLDPKTYTEHDISVATLQSDLERMDPQEDDAMRGELPDHYEFSMEQARWVDQAHTGVDPEGRYEPDLPDDQSDDDGAADIDHFNDGMDRVDYDGSEAERLDRSDEPPQDDTPFRTWDPRTRRDVTKEEAANAGQVFQAQMNEEIMTRVRDTISPEIIRGLTVEEQQHSDSDLSDTETTYKVCMFCSSDPPVMDPMNVHMIARFLDPIGRIIPRIHTGLCSLHQRKLARTIKRAHHMKLLSYKRRTFVINDPFAPPVSRLTRFGDDDELHPSISEGFVDKHIEKIIQEDQDSIDAETQDPFQVYSRDPAMNTPLTDEESRIVEAWKAEGIKFEIPDPVLGFNKPRAFTTTKKKQKTDSQKLRQKIGLDQEDDELDEELARLESEFAFHNDVDAASDDDDNFDDQRESPAQASQ